MISKVSACLCLTCDLFLITPLALLGPDDVLHKGSPAQVEVASFIVRPVVPLVMQGEKSHEGMSSGDQHTPRK